MSDVLDTLTRQLFNVKEMLSELSEQSKILDKQRIDLEIRIIAAMRAINMDQVRNDEGTFSLKESIVPSNIDWQLLHEYILESGNLELLHKRVSEKEYRDLIQMGETIPGTTPFNKTKLLTKTRKL